MEKGMNKVEEEKAAFAVAGEFMAETAGSADAFVIMAGREEFRVILRGNIPALLKEYRVKTFVCGGIGNCLLEVLTQNGIRVIAGVAGGFTGAAASFRAGTLTSGEKYTCTERGQICGDCKGKY